MLNLLIAAVKYNDYLIHTLHHNKDIFDTIYVVSSPDDKEILSVIEKTNIKDNIKLLITDEFYKDGDWGKTIFNKGGGINFGLMNIPKQDWLIIGDADCIYPKSIKTIISDLNIDCLYGMYRDMVKDPKLIKSSVVKMNHVPIDDSFLSKLIDAHSCAVHDMIMGYCQLFNFNSPFIKDKNVNYPSGKSCRYIDTIFSRSVFPKRKRKMLKNCYCIHLGKTGENWYGRKSEKFA